MTSRPSARHCFPEAPLVSRHNLPLRQPTGYSGKARGAAWARAKKMDRDPLKQGHREMKQYATWRWHTWPRWCPLFIRPVWVLNITSHCPHHIFPGPHISLALLHCIFGFTVAWFLYEQVDKQGFGAKYQGSNPSSSQLCNLR